uniref:Uncharacterized protein n=1 Tax=Candidatus Kentrum sp. DK TaxID=2126562 RepID=A0A450T861_9GAMM|nr:MAG: hypothetical protein BECKDK2373B_GA0170837_111721 [Candidatus Kentron sp. DK]VFJ65914.1 MAG: hypothetical protein BECKDK2373C_GA0170839_11382 [Candidatus Kentron sp. DK]
MRIAKITPQKGNFLTIVAEDGRSGVFDIRPYPESSAFRPLTDRAEFSRILSAAKAATKPVAVPGTGSRHPCRDDVVGYVQPFRENL